MVDVLAMPDKSFGYVPTPAIVGPLEFTLRRDAYQALGGHMERVQSLADAARQCAREADPVARGAALGPLTPLGGVGK